MVLCTVVLSVGLCFIIITVLSALSTISSFFPLSLNFTLPSVISAAMSAHNVVVIPTGTFSTSMV